MKNSMPLQFNAIMTGCPQLTPGNTQFETGQRNGVGRNSRLWVGISIKICNGHASSQIGRWPSQKYTMVATTPKISKLCVIPYNVNVHCGMSPREGAPI